jgi:hypothetical protein
MYTACANSDCFDHSREFSPYEIARGSYYDLHNCIDILAFLWSALSTTK